MADARMQMRRQSARVSTGTLLHQHAFNEVQNLSFERLVLHGVEGQELREGRQNAALQCAQVRQG